MNKDGKFAERKFFSDKNAHASCICVHHFSLRKNDLLALLVVRIVCRSVSRVS